MSILSPRLSLPISLRANMKELSTFFLLKNSLGVKMRKGFKNFCNDDGSTSTLNQHKANPVDHYDDDPPAVVPASVISSPYVHNNVGGGGANAPTLEQMILQLELEEEMARKAKRTSQNYAGGMMKGRRSCVNSSDILRSARNALNQYPRFSLDGKDAMYRSSFRNSDAVGKPGRQSVCCDRGLRERMYRNGNFHDSSFGRSSCSRCSTSAGESVVWCKPGVVAMLMGLEAMPVPINSRSESGKETLSCIIKRQNQRRRAERREMERRVSVDTSSDGIRKERMASCSKYGYCTVMKPVAADLAATDIQEGWPTRRFR